jgi:hypothetical protein
VLTRRWRSRPPLVVRSCPEGLFWKHQRKPAPQRGRWHQDTLRPAKRAVSPKSLRSAVGGRCLAGNASGYWVTRAWGRTKCVCEVIEAEKRRERRESALPPYAHALPVLVRLSVRVLGGRRSAHPRRPLTLPACLINVSPSCECTSRVRVTSERASKYARTYAHHTTSRPTTVFLEEWVAK